MKASEEDIKQITVPTPFPVGDVHLYLLIGERISIVDAGVKTKQAEVALYAGLAKHGLEPEDIDQVILTHHHPDHIGMVDCFPNAISVIGHYLNQPWLTREESFLTYYENFLSRLYAYCGVPASYRSSLKKPHSYFAFVGKSRLTAALTEGDRLPGHEAFTVLETKGHAQSHLSFYRQGDGAFIGGDLLLPLTSSNPLIEPPEQLEGKRPKPLLQYRASLQRCKGLDIKTVYPGHGPVFFDADGLIDKRLHKQEQRAEKVWKILTEGSGTPFQICQKLFPKQIDHEFELTMSETIGQLDYLEAQGRVIKTVQNETWLYTNIR